MTLAAIVLLAILIFSVAAVLWVTLCIGPAMRAAVEPRLRTDLATTPQDAGTFLWQRLRTRIYLSAVPAAIAAVGLIFGFILGLDAALNHKGNHYDIPVFVYAIATMTVFHPSLMATMVTIASMFSSAARACSTNQEYSIIHGALSSAMRSAVVVVACLFFAWLLSCLFGMFAGSHGPAAENASALGMVFAAAFTIFPGILLLRRTWRRLVAVYLDLDAKS